MTKKITPAQAEHSPPGPHDPRAPLTQSCTIQRRPAGWTLERDGHIVIGPYPYLDDVIDARDRGARLC